VYVYGDAGLSKSHKVIDFLSSAGGLIALTVDVCSHKSELTRLDACSHRCGAIQQWTLAHTDQESCDNECLHIQIRSHAIAMEMPY